jgi:hypothetical protein
MLTEKLMIVYWMSKVGIGSSSGPPAVLEGEQTVRVPLTDVLKYRRADGSYQINVVNLVGGNFKKRTCEEGFLPPYLHFDDALIQVFNDGSVQKLQQAGIKVVLTIMGDHGYYGWSSIPEDKIQDFVDYLNVSILNPTSGFGLDGIDIDDEYYACRADSLVPTVKAMYETFPEGTIISKALWNDFEIIPAIKDYLTYGCTMAYGNKLACFQEQFAMYMKYGGLKASQLLIGVHPGPVSQPNTNFTSLETTRALALWEPPQIPEEKEQQQQLQGNDNNMVDADDQIFSIVHRKRGMMLWTFSQDIPQFTADPQNQSELQFPCQEKDHSWQRTIIDVFDRQSDSPSSHNLRGSEKC